jgi:hypothetical protein
MADSPSTGTKSANMVKCISCGTELHPERAEKYDYCTAAECQKANARGLTVVAVGVNKSADQYELLDEQTRQEMADGRYHDPRRGSFGRREPVLAPEPRSAAESPSTRRPLQRSTDARQGRPAARKWTEAQEKLALLYNEQGIRPDEIARRLGISTYLATQIVLGARKRRGR